MFVTNTSEVDRGAKGVAIVMIRRHLCSITDVAAVAERACSSTAWTPRFGAAPRVPRDARARVGLDQGLLTGRRGSSGEAGRGDAFRVPVFGGVQRISVRCRAPCPCARTVCGLRPPAFQGASYNLALFVFRTRALLPGHLASAAAAAMLFALRRQGHPLNTRR